MAKKGRVFEPVSVPIEDQIITPFVAIGRAEWFETAFYPGVIRPEEKCVIRTDADLEPHKTWMRAQKALGADTETTGRIVKGDRGYSMNPINPGTRMVCAQIGTEEKVLLIEPDLLPKFKEEIESDKILWILQNALYDFKWILTKYMIHLCRIYDTMLAEQLLTAGLLGVRVGLADMVRKYDPFYIISKAVRSLFIELCDSKMNREMVKYAVRDIPTLFPVFRAQVVELQKYGMMKVAKMEFDCVPCTAELELGGVYLNEQKLELLIKYWIQKQDDMGKQILNMFSDRMKEVGKGSSFLIPEMVDVFDLGSAAQKLEALRELGFTLDDTKRQTLLQLNDPLANLLGEYSNVTKWTSTYGENMRNKINPVDGMWHPRFSQMGAGEIEQGADAGRDTTTTTATGRYASDAQQFPRKQDRYDYERDPDMKRAVMLQFATEIAELNKKNVETV